MMITLGFEGRRSREGESILFAEEGSGRWVIYVMGGGSRRQYHNSLGGGNFCGRYHCAREWDKSLHVVIVPGRGRSYGSGGSGFQEGTVPLDG